MSWLVFIVTIFGGIGVGIETGGGLGFLIGILSPIIGFSIAANTMVFLGIASDIKDIKAFILKIINK